MKEKKTDKVLLEQYHDPENPGNYGGVSRFAKNQGISVKKAKAILKTIWAIRYTSQHDASFLLSLGKCLRSTSNGRRISLKSLTNKTKQRLQIFVDGGGRFFLKYAWVEPIKTKTGQAVTDAFEKILKQGRKPIQLQTDSEKEFYNKTFAQLLKRCNIHHFWTSGDTKASVVERFNRTLKQRMYRYFTTNNT